MASLHSSTTHALLFSLALATALFVQGTLGKIECQDLKKESCAYAVSSSGKRCVLEKRVRGGGEEEYACGTSEIEADERVKDWIETDECIKGCGLDRSALGISSDSLLDSRSARELCSDKCYRSCPNIVDLYFNLAAGEGVYLPKFCEALRRSSRREMVEIKSSGYVAAAPKYGKEDNMLLSAPSLAPF